MEKSNGIFRLINALNQDNNNNGNACPANIDMTSALGVAALALLDLQNPTQGINTLENQRTIVPASNNNIPPDIQPMNGIDARTIASGLKRNNLSLEDIFRAAKAFKVDENNNDTNPDEIEGAAHLPEITFPHGVYTGEVKDGNIPHGEGEMRYTNGMAFKGKWRSGKPYGLGKTTYPNGDVTTGYYKYDLPKLPKETKFNYV